MWELPLDAWIPPSEALKMRLLRGLWPSILTGGRSGGGWTVNFDPQLQKGAGAFPLPGRWTRAL
jgi:hypothetical protein